MKKIFFSFILLLFEVISYGQEIQKILPTPYLNTTQEYYGESVAIEGDYAVVGDPGYNSNLGCAYVLHFTGSEWQTVARLTAEEPLPAPFGATGFGCDVDICGDIVIVGADETDSEGAVYLYEKPATGWQDMTETAKLTANVHGSFYDYFGHSVSIDGDYIVVGAYNSNLYGLEYGLAYIFEKPLNGWTDMTETCILTATNMGKFGADVDISGDIVVVGAYKANQTGLAYVYEKPDTGWTDMTETAILSPSDGQVGDYFGYSVSIDDSTIAVGAPGLGAEEGAVYVYEKTEYGWIDTTETIKFRPSNTSNRQNFGNSIDIEGDYVVVGILDEYAPSNSNVYIFKKSSSGWSDTTETALLTASDLYYYDEFGKDVAISGNIILAGNPEDDDNAVDCGSVYYYIKQGEYWTNQVAENKVYSITMSNFNDNFGNSVSVYNDYAVVGIPNYDNEKGCAEVYHLIRGEWEKVATLQASDSYEGMKFGQTVKIYDNTIVVGYDVETNYRSGRIYVFEKPYNGWQDTVETAILMILGSDTQCFGASFDIYDNIIVGGNFNAWINEVQTGAAYVFVKPETGWRNMTQTATLTASDGEAYDNFGRKVSVFDNIIAVGAYFDDDLGQNTGAVYIFEKPYSGWTDMTETAKLLPSDGNNKNEFGSDLDIYGYTIAVTNRHNDIYIFQKSAGGWQNLHENALLTPSGYSSYGVVSLFNNILVLGSKDFDNTGAVFVFKKPAAGWQNANEDIILKPTDIKSGDEFGTAVAIYNSSILVGAIGVDDNFSNSGAVYYFDKNYLADMKKLNTQSIWVYPNPTNGIFKYIVPSNTQYIEITDISGHILMRKNNFFDNLSFDLSNFSNGVYLLKIYTDNDIFVQKILKN